MPLTESYLTFSTRQKPPQPLRPNAAFRGTTKAKQIEFMWHLYRQGFSKKEIAMIYDTDECRVNNALNTKAKNS